MASRFYVRRSLLLTLVAAVPSRVRAQGGPTSELTLIVPAGQGGTADRVGRHVAALLGEISESRVEVRNISGLQGATGTSAIAAAPSHGRVIGLAVSTSMIASRLLSQYGVTYQPMEDFEWLAILGSYPNALVVPSKEPAPGFKEWLERARASPTPLVIGTFGIGSMGHLAAGFLHLEQKLNVTARPYESVDAAYRELAAGTLDALLDGAPNASVEAPKAGHRLLAVTSAERVPRLPDTPAFGELWPGQAFNIWVGLIAPKGVPAAEHSRLASAIGVLLLQPRYVDSLRREGVTIIGLTGQKARGYVEDEIVRTARLIARLSESRPAPVR